MSSLHLTVYFCLILISLELVNLQQICNKICNRFSLFFQFSNHNKKGEAGSARINQPHLRSAQDVILLSRDPPKWLPFAKRKVEGGDPFFITDYRVAIKGHLNKDGRVLLKEKIANQTEASGNYCNHLVNVQTTKLDIFMYISLYLEISMYVSIMYMCVYSVHIVCMVV